MLVERAFAIGGAACLTLGGLLFVAAALAGIGLAYTPFLVGAALMVGFGGFFLHVGAEARRERLRLLRTGEEGVVGSDSGGPRG